MGGELFINFSGLAGANLLAEGLALAELERPRGFHPYNSEAPDPQKPYKLEPKERQIELIRFLIGKGELPNDLESIVSKTIGRDRLKRQFQSLTPELRVALIDPLLRTDRGLYADPVYREKLMELALEGVDPHQKEARLLLESLLYALQQTAPHEVTFALSFIISQIGDRSVSPARRLRVALESMGNTGVSIGQKLYQRKLLSVEYLRELPDLQDCARPLTRLEIFEMMAENLGIEATDLLAVAESAGAEIRPEVYDYLTALGHIEHYALPDPTLPGAPTPFAVKIKGRVEEAVKPLREKYSLAGIRRRFFNP